MPPLPPRNRSSTAIPINPRILTVAIPDAPRIRSGADMREVLVTITDHVGILTQSVQEIAGSQSELVGSVIGLRGYIDQAFERAVSKAAQVAVEEACKVAEDTARESVPEIVRRVEDDKELAARRAQEEERKAKKDKLRGAALRTFVTVAISASTGGLIVHLLKLLFH